MRRLTRLTRRSRTQRRVGIALVAGIAASALGVGATGFPAADATTLPALSITSQSLAGRLLVAHGDDFESGAMIMQTELRTDAGVVPLAVSPSEHSEALALAGQRVDVRGLRLSRSFSVVSISPSSGSIAATARAVPSASSLRSMRIAVVMLRLPGTAAPVSKAAARASTFGATKSVANWFSQTSGGRVKVTGTVYGYYPGVKSCDLATQLAAGAAAAAKNGYVASNYDHLVVYEPLQSCGFGGIGWVGDNGAFLNGTVSPGVMEHELGHNLGLWHSGAFACGTSKLSKTCLTDYGDMTDVMGDPYLNHGYNAQHKFALGWIPASEVRTVKSGTQTISLTASENPVVAGSIELVHVRAADGAMYAIDRRASVGYDKGLSGVWIRRIGSMNTDDTELVRSSALPAGASYVDALHHVTIKTLTDRGARASIRVCVGKCTPAA